MTDFRHMAFRHVPDYWVFRAVAETALFRYRSTLEAQLDKKHDETAGRHFFGKASLQDDLERHRKWSEAKTETSLSVAPRAVLQVPTKSLREKTKTECRTRMMML